MNKRSIFGNNLFIDELHVHNRLHDDAARRQADKTETGAMDGDSRGTGTPGSARGGRSGHSEVIVQAVGAHAVPPVAGAPSVKSAGTPSKRSGLTAAPAGYLPRADLGAKPLSFEAFMRSLAIDHPHAYGGGAEAYGAEHELTGESVFSVDGLPSARSEDEMFEESLYASAPASARRARSTTPRSGHRANESLQESVLPEWVRMTIPTQSAAPNNAAVSSPGPAVPAWSRWNRHHLWKRLNLSSTLRY
jgi:hypothetical protein